MHACKDAYTAQYYTNTNGHEERNPPPHTFNSVFHAVIHKKSKVKRVNLLALWHKKSWNTGASLQANQSEANEKGKIVYMC